MILGQSWHFVSPDHAALDRFIGESGLPAIIARFLYRRGIYTPEAADFHLNPMLKSLNDPWKMKDMDKAADRLVRAVIQKERMAIFGDYDVDGVTSSALVYKFLKELGLDVDVYIPHRDEGYGLNIKGIKELASRGCRLLITVDCGITSNEEVSLAKGLGMDVIVTDHHEPPASLPEAVAVLDPKRSDCPFPFKELAGVGVAFNLMRALRHRLYRSGYWNGGQIPNLKVYLDLVALGTVADVVPLLGDNRILVRAGLEVLNKSTRPGIKALKAVCGLDSDVTSRDIGFRIGPRINAAGRMAHADRAFKLLISENDADAKAMAEELNRLNQERQAEERLILKDALAEIESSDKRPAYVLASPGWKRGIIGIVASRLVEQFCRPVILLAMDGDEAYGSGRSPEGINLYKCLCACADHLTAFGGHKAAAGMHLPLDSIEGFRRAFERVVSSVMEQNAVSPRLEVDGAARIDELLDPDFYRLYGQLEPFGAGYPAPLLALQDFTVSRSKVVGNGHLKLTLRPQSNPQNRYSRSMDLLGWGQGDKQGLPWERLELACMPCFNVWQGQRRLELRLKDIRYK
ncbi:MAG: single-stranded-DNA-specific exonuclease RecJ [Nitrospiraceae bacterium]|nr:single-stranded-DNA-specific exonuclease RecJ [Nitrospiraceae bacterium]